MRLVVDKATSLRCKAAQCLRRARELDDARGADLQSLAADYARRAHAEGRDSAAA